MTQYESTKEMWDKLVNRYEGDTRVKSAKLQSCWMQYETLQMHEDESIANFFLKVDEVVVEIACNLKLLMK